jgi:hypothetical protein
LEPSAECSIVYLFTTLPLSNNFRQNRDGGPKFSLAQGCLNDALSRSEIFEKLQTLKRETAACHFRIYPLVIRASACGFDEQVAAHQARIPNRHLHRPKRVQLRPHLLPTRRHRRRPVRSADPTFHPPPASPQLRSHSRPPTRIPKPGTALPRPACFSLIPPPNNPAR